MICNSCWFIYQTVDKVDNIAVHKNQPLNCWNLSSANLF